MGGFGSGGYRWGQRRRLVENCVVLDIHVLARADLFLTHPELVVRWNDSLWGIATFDPQRRELRVVFQPGGKPIDQVIGISSVRCHLAGQRHYFQCPQCGTRATKLYLPHRATAPPQDTGNGFACRRCWGLVYESRNIQNRFHIAIRRVGRVERTLGGRPSVLGELPPKPKRMRWHTYNHLAEIYAAERRSASEELFNDYLKHFGKKSANFMRAAGSPSDKGRVR